MIIRTRKNALVVLGEILAVVGLIFYPPLVTLGIGVIIGAGLDVQLERNGE